MKERAKVHVSINAPTAERDGYGSTSFVSQKTYDATQDAGALASRAKELGAELRLTRAASLSPCRRKRSSHFRELNARTPAQLYLRALSLNDYLEEEDDIDFDSAEGEERAPLRKLSFEGCDLHQQQVC